MLKAIKPYIILMIMTILMVLVFIAILQTSAYKKCNYDYQAQSVTQRGSSSEYQLIQANFTCFIEGVDSHSGVIAALATIIIAFFTATLATATKGMLHISAEQSKAMERSISEATRSATAMEKVSESIAASAKAATESVDTTKKIANSQEAAMEMQMRAYLTIIIGGGTYQEKKQGLKFASEPIIINTGHTPAHEVTFRINADILPIQLPPDFTFPILQEVKGGSIIGPHQNVTISSVIKDFVNEEEVEDIKFLRKKKGLYVWGIVNYIDVFNKKRETEFAQIIYWLPDGTVKGLYVPKHNKAT